MPDHLTTGQGTPVPDDRNSLTAGRRGPTLLADHHLLEKLAHLNRERLPERIVGARGAAAFGVFQPTEGLADYTKAALFTKDRSTPVSVRFSMFTHGRQAPETLRDLRGMAVKFYTSEGNFDLVCGSLPVFFIRDGMQFPDLVHALKPSPVTGLSEVERFFDFLSFVPEATHMLVWLYSDMGTPKSYRHMPAYSVNAYVWVNARGAACYVKYHWRPTAGQEFFTAEQAQVMQARDVSHATRDLYAALRSGSTVDYDLFVQLMALDEQGELGLDPLDATVLWPEERWPLIPAGRMSLNRPPLNDFAESEQLAAGPANAVPGIELSTDRLLQARAFAYADAQRHRLGPNHQQLPVNRPRIAAHTNQQDGLMALDFSSSSVNYSPSGEALYEPTGQPFDVPMQLEDTVTREPIALVNDFRQAGASWRAFPVPMQVSVVANLGDQLALVQSRRVVDAISANLRRADPALGDAVLRRAQGRLTDLDAFAADLAPPQLVAEPAPDEPAATSPTPPA
jgi:catalase